MLEINNLEITKDTMYDLLISLKKAQREIQEGNIAFAEYRIGTLVTNLEVNLEADRRKENEEVYL